MPSHRARRRSDRNLRDCCYKPLPSPLRSATLLARNSKTKSGEVCLASFSCSYVNEELSYSRPRTFAQMRTKANGSTRKKHRILRPRFLIVEVAEPVLNSPTQGTLSVPRFGVAKSSCRATTSASDLAVREKAEMPQRMLHAVLNRMKCEAEQSA